MAIDTGKILNISIESYTNKHNHDYKEVGVHCDKESIEDFASLVPDEAEVVVNYEHNFFGAGSNDARYKFLHHQVGVALIPKIK